MVIDAAHDAAANTHPSAEGQLPVTADDTKAGMAAQSVLPSPSESVDCVPVHDGAV